MHLTEMRGKLSLHKSLCPPPFNDNEVITSLKCPGCHLTLIPPGQDHLCQSLTAPPWLRVEALINETSLALVEETVQYLGPRMNVPPTGPRYILPLTIEDSQSTLEGNH
jgi:hypothetical protein